MVLLRLKNIYSKNNPKILYDKESQVLSIEFIRAKSVDSNIADNVVIDYDKKGKVVRTNLYNFSFNSFRNQLKQLKTYACALNLPLTKLASKETSLATYGFSFGKRKNL